jgi:hypothetical protein
LDGRSAPFIAARDKGFLVVLDFVKKTIIMFFDVSRFFLPSSQGMKLPDQRLGLPGKVLGYFHIASLDPDSRSGLAGSRPVNQRDTLIGGGPFSPLLYGYQR